MVYDLDGIEGLEKMKKGQGMNHNNPFAQLFGGGGGGSGRKRGPDFKTHYSVTLEDLYNGAQKEMQITRNVLCRSCKGSGAKDGKTKQCKTCQGSGQVTKLKRLGPGFNVQMQEPCGSCGGKGKTALKKCPVCSGKKVSQEPKTLEIEIEKGHFKKIYISPYFPPFFVFYYVFY